MFNSFCCQDGSSSLYMSGLSMYCVPASCKTSETGKDTVPCLTHSGVRMGAVPCLTHSGVRMGAVPCLTHSGVRMGAVPCLTHSGVRMGAVPCLTHSGVRMGAVPCLTHSGVRMGAVPCLTHSGVRMGAVPCTCQGSPCSVPRCPVDIRNRKGHSNTFNSFWTTHGIIITCIWMVPNQNGVCQA